MRTIEVANKSTTRKFLELPFLIYKDDPNWVCPLNNDIESVFDPKKNNFFNYGKCTRWILVNEKDEKIGQSPKVAKKAISQVNS